MASRPLSQRLFRMLIGALVGAGICGLATVSGLLEWMKEMPAEDILSSVLALFFVLMAVFAAIVSTSTGAYKAIAENYREGDPVDDKVLGTMRSSALLLLISGGLLLAPPVAVRLGAGEETSILVAAAMGVLLLLVSWMSWRMTRSGDELTRSLSIESSAVSLWILTLGLFGWTSLVKLGLAPEVSSWTLMTITMAVSLVVQIGMSMRRGLFA